MEMFKRRQKARPTGPSKHDRDTPSLYPTVVQPFIETPKLGPREDLDTYTKQGELPSPRSIFAHSKNLEHHRSISLPEQNAHQRQGVHHCSLHENQCKSSNRGPPDTHQQPRGLRMVYGAKFDPLEREFQTPIKYAIVLLQGAGEADRFQLEDCLDRLGFGENYRNVYTSSQAFTTADAERLIFPISVKLVPGSNLLLIICAIDYNGIQLSEGFLTSIYEKIASKNTDLQKQRDLALKKNKEKVFDTRRYAGITLHVILDNVLGSKLPFALTFSQTFRETSLRATWKKILSDTKTNTPLQKMQTGRIVQFCSDAKRYSHLPGALFCAFININVDEAFLPYNVFAYRILNALDHEFQQPSSKITRTSTRKSTGQRMGEEAILLPFHLAFVVCVQQYKNYNTKRLEDRIRMMDETGETIISSASQFDPNLSLDFDWNYDNIPCTTQQSI